MRLPSQDGAPMRRAILLDTQRRERATHSLRVQARLAALGTSLYRPLRNGEPMASPLLAVVRGAIAARIRHTDMPTYAAIACSRLGITVDARSLAGLAEALDTAIPNAHRNPDVRVIGAPVPPATPALTANGLLALYSDMAYTSADTRQLGARLADVKMQDALLRGLRYVRGMGQALGIPDVAPVSTDGTIDTAYSAHASHVIDASESESERAQWRAMTDRDAHKRRDARKRSQAIQDANARRKDAMRDATDKLAQRFTVKRG